MMEARTDRFTDTVFSWSFEDIFNENLYKNQVQKIPESFDSVKHYFSSYLYPLLEETRAQVHSSMETVDRSPFAEVVAFEKCNPYGPYGENVYHIKVDCWENRVNDRGKEPYKTLPGDLLIVLADSKPETVSDLRRVGRSFWAFVSVTYVPENEDEDDIDSPENEDEDDIDNPENEDEDDIDSTSLYFRVKRHPKSLKSTIALIHHCFWFSWRI